MSAPASSTATLSAIDRRMTRLRCGSTREGYPAAPRRYDGLPVVLRQQRDDLLVAHLAEAVVVEADREEPPVPGGSEQPDLVAIARDQLGAVRRRDGDRRDQPPGCVTAHHHERCREGVSGGHPVVDHHGGGA